MFFVFLVGVWGGNCLSPHRQQLASRSYEEDCVTGQSTTTVQLHPQFVPRCTKHSSLPLHHIFLNYLIFKTVWTCNQWGCVPGYREIWKIQNLFTLPVYIRFTVIYNYNVWTNQSTSQWPMSKLTYPALCGLIVLVHSLIFITHITAF